MNGSGNGLADMRKIMESVPPSERQDDRFVTGRAPASLVSEGGSEQIGQQSSEAINEHNLMLEEEDAPIPVSLGEVTRKPSGMPRALLSYSWGGIEHRNWVSVFAERLQGDSGVEIIFDQWQLNPGDALLNFMEKGVAESDFVIVVCAPSYAERADKRHGGVGYKLNLLASGLTMPLPPLIKNLRALRADQTRGSASRQFDILEKPLLQPSVEAVVEIRKSGSIADASYETTGPDP